VKCPCARGADFFPRSSELLLRNYSVSRPAQKKRRDSIQSRANVPKTTRAAPPSSKGDVATPSHLAPKFARLSLSLSQIAHRASGLALVLEGVLVRLEQILKDALAARVTRGVDGLDLDLGAHAEERVDARQQLALGGGR